MLKAVILVGGETTGTRFRPLSMDAPKVLFPIAGKPLISHILDTLIDLRSDGLEQVFLIGFFKDASVFHSYIELVQETYSGLKIEYLSEPYSMGTGGGLYYFRDRIFSEDSLCKLLVIHGDIVCNYPFREMVDFYRSHKATLVILGVDPLLLVNNYQNKVQVQNHSRFKVYKNFNAFNNYGAIISNKQTHQVVHYVEKPSQSLSQFQSETKYNTLVSGGVFMFDMSIIQLLAKAQAHKARTIDEKQCQELYDNEDEPTIKNANILSIELDVLKFLASDNTKFLTFKSKSFWYQLKTSISALFINNFFLEKSLQDKVPTDLMPPSKSIIPPVRFVEPKQFQLNEHKIGPNVSVGKNVVIGKGVRLKNCIIADGVSIGNDSIIMNAIVSSDLTIGKWCRIEGTFGNNTIGKDISKVHTDGYFKLINNIVVLCSNTTVHNLIFVYNSIVLPNKELKKDVKYEIVM